MERIVGVNTPMKCIRISFFIKSRTNSSAKKTAAPAPAVAPAVKRVTPESVLKKRKANEKIAAERALKDIERRKVCSIGYDVNTFLIASFGDVASS